jgi:DNA-3-methyladenine glycosylase I
MSYCEYVKSHPLHKAYHDTEYGFLITDDNALFERLLLEINQAGLSWDLMLKKRESMRSAYSGFDIATIASYTEADRFRLKSDPGIIRNSLKINAAIHNAQQLQLIIKEYGSFFAWLKHYHPQDKPAWVKLFKKTFKFTGGEIVGEFLMSIGFLSGAHERSCPFYQPAKESFQV